MKSKKNRQTTIPFDTPKTLVLAHSQTILVLEALPPDCYRLSGSIIGMIGADCFEKNQN